MSNSQRSRRSNMGHRSRRRHSRGQYTGEPNGLQPGDDVGNRRSMKQATMPPDDVGNRKEPLESSAFLPDDSGNRVDLPPTHEISGILADLDGRRRRKKKSPGTLLRIGRYFVGGVNPLVSGMQPPVKPVTMPSELPPESEANIDLDEGDELDEDGLGRKKRRRRRRRDGRDQIDGVAAQEVSVRRAQRFFDFEEDDRFEYVLKSDAQSKCDAARDAVASVLRYAQRDASVEARVIEDRDRPKVVVTIEERGPAASMSAQEQSERAAQPLFVLGNAALMALNYLVNKIVNRYPDDRIRLAILPKADEALYLDSLAQHLKSQAEKSEPEPAVSGTEEPIAVSAPMLNGKAHRNGVHKGKMSIATDATDQSAVLSMAGDGDALPAVAKGQEDVTADAEAEPEAPKKKGRAKNAKPSGAKTAKATNARSRGLGTESANVKALAPSAVEVPDTTLDDAAEAESGAVKKSAVRKKTTKKVAKKTSKKVTKLAEEETPDIAAVEEAEPKTTKTTKKTPTRASKKVTTSRKTKTTKSKTEDEAEDS